MNTFVYVFFITIANVSSFIILLLAGNRATEEAIAALPIPIILALVFWLIFVGKAWGSIQDGKTKPSAGGAVGMLFIPGFNYYWIFVVFPGFATAYNKYIERNGVQVPPMSKGMLVTMAIFVLLPIPFVAWTFHIIGIVQVCGAVKRLKRAQAAA